MLEWLSNPDFIFFAIALLAAATYWWRRRRYKGTSIESCEALHAACAKAIGSPDKTGWRTAQREPVPEDVWKPGLKLSAANKMELLQSHSSQEPALEHRERTGLPAADPKTVALASASSALEVLNCVEIGTLQQAGSLQVFGLKWLGGDTLEYATLDEALEDKVLEITEINERGQVPAVKLENKAKRMVFMMAGELLVGCKQDRVLTTSLMIPGKTELLIPVACVEVGRWGYSSRKFSSAQTSSHSYLRLILSKETSARYGSKSATGSGQGAVWAEVARKMSRMGSSSSSGALQDIFKECDRKLNRLLQNLSFPAECNGAAFATNGTLLGLDLFDKQATFARLWPKLAKSYAVDALEDASGDQIGLHSETVLAWTKAAQSAKQDWFDSPGLGQDVRIEGDMLTGGALVVGERLIHLQLFQKNKVVEGFSSRSVTQLRNRREGPNLPRPS